MRLIAEHKSRVATFVVVLLLTTSPAVGQRVATCKKPPGGQITCEEAQVASCAVDTSGSVEGRCRNIPKNMGSSEETKAWFLGETLDKAITVKDLEKPEYRSILEKHEIKSGSKTITFSIPEDISIPRSENRILPDSTIQPSSVNSQSCRVCVTIHSRETCEDGTGQSREEARRSALSKLCPEGVPCPHEIRTTCAD